MWRCVVGAGDAAGAEPATSGARNMAVDHALLEGVRAGGPAVLRLYAWDPPCLSLGRNQAARDVFDAARARALGIGIVRRPTGGLAVLHDRELTYSVAVPASRFGGPRATFLALHRALLHGIRRLGVQATLAPRVRGAVPAGAALASPHPCFSERARGEIIAQGRKLVGSAQRAERGTLLQHGSILIEGDQSRVAQLRRMPVPEAEGAITLAELLGRAPGLAEVMDAIRCGFATAVGIPLCDSALDGAEYARATALEAHYLDDTWTWRR